MRIDVKVITRAHKNGVEIVDDVYVVRTTAVPVDNKANACVQKLLAQFFGIAKECVQIVKGNKSRKKICDIDI